MNNVSLCLAAVAVTWACASGAGAACDFDVGPAKGLKTSMVRIYAACPSTDNPTGNTQTEGGTTACTPVSPAEVGENATLYSYGPKGSCTVQFKSKLVAGCEALEDDDGNGLGLQNGPCHVTFVKAKCKDIVGADGESPIGSGDVGFTLATLSRATLSDDTGGDMTVIDFPVSFDFDEPKSGGMKLDSNSAEALIPLVGVANADLPECTSIELISAKIKDPLGLPFATIGGSTVVP